MKYRLLLLAAALIWGFAFVAQVVGMDTVGPFTFNGVRFVIGSLALLPFLYFHREGKSPLPTSIPLWAAFLMVGIPYPAAGGAAVYDCFQGQLSHGQLSSHGSHHRPLSGTAPSSQSSDWRHPGHGRGLFHFHNQRLFHQFGRWAHAALRSVLYGADPYAELSDSAFFSGASVGRAVYGDGGAEPHAGLSF